MSILVVLDAGGVILSDLTEVMLSQVADATGCDLDRVRQGYRADGLRDKLWMGTVSVDDFWTEFGAHLGVELDPAVWNRRVLEIQRPEVPVSYLKSLADKSDLAVLTNHRGEWFRPLLGSVGISAGLFRQVIVSSEVGFIKPDLDIYQCLDVAASDARLFVDDKEENLIPAQKLGYDVILADDSGAWQSQVEEWINDRA